MKIFSKKFNLLLSISSLLFFSLINTIHSEEINFNNSPYAKSLSTYTTSLQINVKFSSNQIKEYTKIYLNETNTRKSFVISVFSDNNLQKRIQMDQGISGTPKLWLKKSQTEGKTLYTKVECDTPPCNFKINIEPTDDISLNIGEQMSYYVTQENKQMKFSFNAISQDQNLVMNIWALGSLNINSVTENIVKMKKYKNNYYVFKPSEQSGFIYSILVTANQGDFINVGSILYKNEIATQIINVDENSVKVFLAKNILDKACFKMKLNDESITSDIIFGTGIIDSNVVQGYRIDENDAIIENTKEIFTQGSITMYLYSDEISKQKVCFSFPDNDYKNIDEIVLSFQLNLGHTVNKGVNIFEPQENGKTYPRYLKKGHKMAFIGQNPGNNYNEINFNMIASFGFPKMTILECENYPLCFKTGEIKNEIIPHNVNKFTTYSIYKNEITGEYSPVNLKQNVLIVECKGSQKNSYGDKSYDDICVFGTLIYSDISTIYLVENQYFNQYLLKEETDSFNIDFLNLKNIKQIYVDINVFSGEVRTIFNEADGNDYKEYYNANKIYFIVTLSELLKLKEINFKVTAVKNSFYTIQYSYIHENDDSSKKNFLLSGSSYLITVNAKKEGEGQKIVSFINTRQIDELPFLVNFYSLNCKIEILAKRVIDTDYVYTNLETYDYFTQDLYTKENGEKQYNAESYDYNLTVKEEDFTDYENKRCMLYASAIELTKHGDSFEREIVIGENAEQQIIFKKVFNQVTYLYPCVEPDEDIYIRFNLIDKAKYNVYIYYEYEQGETFLILYSQTKHLDTQKRKNICKEKNEVCNVIINIELKVRTEDSDNEPMLEMELKTSNNNSISYLQKNNMKIDFIPNNSTHHYYAEIGSNEECSVFVNFHRGSGKILAKLIEINAIEPDGEWRGKYNFPKNVNDSLPYDSFTKSVHFITKSEQCKKGCYLLIKVYSDVENSIMLNSGYTFSIIVNSILKYSNYQKYQSISILTEEFVVGNVGGVSQNIVYYEVWINKDAENVLIDFQSESAELFVIIGESEHIPGNENEDFKFDQNGKDTLYRITKNEILEKGKEKYPNVNNTIKDIILTIGVRANAMDSLYTSVYSFMVHLDTQKKLDIYEVNSDQKTLCETTENNNNINYPNRCLFVIKPESYNKYNDLIIYANLQNNSALYQIYADYIEIEDYELWNVANINSKISKADFQFSTEKNKTDYLYLSKGLNEKYLLVSVVSKIKGTVELMTSFYSCEEKITPNPSTSQLFMIKDKFLELKFDDQNLYMVYLTSFEGEAEIYWGKEPNETYYLRGRDDKLTISSISGSSLIIKNLNQNKSNNENPGFAFYLSYTIKYEKNFNEISFGKSANFVYSNSNLPLILYTKLPDFSKNINIFFSLYDIRTKKNKNFNEISLKISGAILKQSTLFSIRADSTMSIEENTMIKGIYDNGVRTGFLRLTTKNLKKFNYTENEKPYLYLMISDSFQRKTQYSKINLEITIVQENSYITTTEKVYQYGTISQNESSVYKLRPNLLKPKMRIEFSSTTSKINYTISTNPETENSLKILNKKQINGRKIIDFEAEPTKNDYIYLIVKKQKQKQKIKKKDNYVFKYINYAEEGLLKDYEIKDSTVKIERKVINKKKNKIKYILTFNAVPNSKNFNVTYLVKIVGSKDKNQKSKIFIPNETIALSENKTSFVTEYKNPKISDGKIILNLKHIPENPKYVEVYAEINDASINEFIAYKIVEFPKNKTTKKKSSAGVFILVIVIGFILSIAVALIIALVFIFKKKKKTLVSQVNKISFQEEDNSRKTGNEGGLLYNDDNTLN